MINVTNYFQPAGEYGQLVVFHFDSGVTQPQQMQRMGDRVVMWKGRGRWFGDKELFDYEQWKVSSAGVQKFIDTSDSGNNGQDAYDLAGAVWIPQNVSVGQTYVSKPTVTRFDRISCDIHNSESTVDYLYIKELIPVWTSPKNALISYNDVLVIEWRKTADRGSAPIETYKFAKNVGYVEWNGAGIGEVPGNQSPLSGELTAC